MAKQTLTFVVLPNGTGKNGKLRLSVYLTPRLEGAATLDQFPDMLHWTRLLQEHGLKFTLTSGARTAAVEVDKSVLRAEIWDAVFPPSAFVEKFKVPPLDDRLLVSYPSRNAAAYLKFVYQVMAVRTIGASAEESRILYDLLSDLIFRQGHSSNLKPALQQLRISLWQDQLHQELPIGRRRASRAATNKSLPPDGIPSTLTKPPQARDMIQRFALYHNMPSAHHRPPLPKTEADFAKTLDFHRALSAVNSFPALLRALGLVFDLEVPTSLCANSPSSVGAPYAGIAVSKVTPGFSWKLATKVFCPETAYLRDANRFSCAPATASADLPGQNYDAADIIDGLLALSPDFFHLTQVDADGALLNLMSLADNLELVSFENLRNENHPVQVEQVLPAMRSGGIALMADDRAQTLLAAIKDNRAFDAALQANSALPRPFNARDLVRGYRLDIRPDTTNQWYSLHRRNGTYQFGTDGKLLMHVEDEEGFTQLAAAQPADDPKRKTDIVAQAAGAPQPGTDIYLHERVARWSGWSLSAQRPGGAINRSADPSRALDPDPTTDQPMTPFKMVASFTPSNASLPRLRFGTRYQMRARAVDLAGNSVPLQHKSDDEMVAPQQMGLPYLRFEPVPHPVVVLREPAKLGASLERLVIRSYNSEEVLDSVPSTESDQRHIIPPRAAVRMAEHHGMFDDSGGKLRGDAATYDMIVARDQAELNSVDGVPLDSRPQIQTPYLSDPIARGAALRNLPFTPADTDGRVKKGALQYIPLDGVEGRDGSVTFIDFGKAWPAREPFRLVLVEGKQKPTWDATHRVLSVHLQKAVVTDVPLSCYLNAADVRLMGVWQWLQEFLELSEQQSALANGPVPPSDSFALLTRLTLEGGHPMITPARTLTLVHAVQKPLSRPEFVMLPVQRPGGQSKALANAFAPLTAWRQFDSHDATLLGGLRIHGQSTAKIDLQATWREFIDDPAQPEPVKQAAGAQVEKIEMKVLTDGPIFANAAEDRMVASYVSKGDTLWFSAPMDTLPGLAAPASLAAPVHQFGDTKHRRVNYQAVACSRFREYFPDGLDHTRISDKVVVNVPSSARPTAPEVLYVVPVFGSEKQETTNVKTAIRRGNGVRVYLQRPWYSSGEGELLGATLWPAKLVDPDTATREKYKPYFTQWGLDPIWASGDLGSVPRVAAFSNAIASAASRTLDGTDLAVDVAGHCVHFDPVRQLWFCDITVDNFEAYTPFIRLAMARYQPHSLPGTELSKVVLADFVQLSPDRSAVVSVDPFEPRQARVFVGGLVPTGPTQPSFTVSVERRMANVQSDAGWEPAPATAVTVVEDPPGSGGLDTMLWSGSIQFAKTPASEQYRVVVREYEILRRDQNLRFAMEVAVAYGQRLVYAAVIPYDFPGKP